ncbi:MAG: V-type ATP synthase subunit D [Defluviitaleaceae bacterium]|nr:V-type ATP synthase subunit D [Defluviitaleaceae bacterium]
MDNLNLPTRRNLLLAKQRLALARKGYDLLDKKRQVLVSELATIQEQAGHIWNQLCEALDIAYAAVHATHAHIGPKLISISQDMPKDATVMIHFRGVMGVELPHMEIIKTKKDKHAIPYSLSQTTVSLDETVQAWSKAQQLIVTQAAIENTIHKLCLHIKKTKKRANALGNITIPMYEARINYIQERLEERERDELARLKLVKHHSATRGLSPSQPPLV